MRFPKISQCHLCSMLRQTQQILIYLLPNTSHVTLHIRYVLDITDGQKKQNIHQTIEIFSISKLHQSIEPLSPTTHHFLLTTRIFDGGNYCKWQAEHEAGHQAEHQDIIFDYYWPTVLDTGLILVKNETMKSLESGISLLICDSV